MLCTRIAHIRDSRHWTLRELKDDLDPPLLLAYGDLHLHLEVEYLVPDASTKRIGVEDFLCISNSSFKLKISFWLPPPADVEVFINCNCASRVSERSQGFFFIIDILGKVVDS